MKTLLHICCAPCANQPIEVLRTDGIEVTGFWYNPNIHPFKEYEARRDCLVDYMAEQTFFDRRDAEIFANMVKHTEYGFFREGARVVIQSVVEQTDTVTSLLESYEDQYAEIVEDYMIHHYEGRVAVYGE